MLVIASEVHHAHNALEISKGALVRSAESPERADMILSALDTGGHQISEPRSADWDLLARVHDPAYLKFLEGAWDRWTEEHDANVPAMSFMWPTRGFAARQPDDLVGQLGYFSFAGDTSIVAGTWSAALEAASIAVTATDEMGRTNAPTFGLCRPPGHHATSDQFGGYCYLNNAAISAQRLLDAGADRVVVLDVDYHHGNGTQSIFYDRSDVQFISIHADPREEFPWFAGYDDERGVGAGEGWNLNLPLPRETGFAAWASALDSALSAIEGADAMVVSLGVDTYENDPLGTFGLTTENFAAVGAQIASVGLPTVILQEGGYAVSNIGENVASFLSGF